MMSEETSRQGLFSMDILLIEPTKVLRLALKNPARRNPKRKYPCRRRRLINQRGYKAWLRKKARRKGRVSNPPLPSKTTGFRSYLKDWFDSIESDETRRQHLLAFRDFCFDLLEEEYGKIRPEEEIDPRFVKGLLVCHSPAR
ncbi:MAG: hypothetical protein EHM36_11105 [Deltaproteobacteria bacterium]|nr:MAG: hypothetical protein EHM36_11105 [Deltaproteobacteria bacterium]